MFRERIQTPKRKKKCGSTLTTAHAGFPDMQQDKGIFPAFFFTTFKTKV
jgi:hypothetical protein